uniref:Uncharacterized protein n=1 Tax=Arundo donax TaxID=35708 RepID=A0A0A9I246_ARUDO
MVRHFIALRKLEELNVLLELEGALYRWTFQAGVGVLVEPEGSLSNFGQFVMNVSFRTRGKAASAWQWRCSSDDYTVIEICP